MIAEKPNDFFHFLHGLSFLLMVHSVTNKSLSVDFYLGKDTYDEHNAYSPNGRS